MFIISDSVGGRTQARTDGRTDYPHTANPKKQRTYI